MAAIFQMFSSAFSQVEIIAYLLKVQASRYINSSPTGQNGRHIADDIFVCFFVNEKFYILIKISLKLVPKDRIDNTQALV